MTVLCITIFGLSYWQISKFLTQVTDKFLICVTDKSIANLLVVKNSCFIQEHTISEMQTCCHELESYFCVQFHDFIEAFHKILLFYFPCKNLRKKNLKTIQIVCFILSHHLLNIVHFHEAKFGNIFSGSFFRHSLCWMS